MLAWPISCRSHKQQRKQKEQPLLLGATGYSCCTQSLCDCPPLQAAPWVGDVFCTQIAEPNCSPLNSALHYQPKSLLGGVLHVGLSRLLKVPLLRGRHVCH